MRARGRGLLATVALLAGAAVLPVLAVPAGAAVARSNVTSPGRPAVMILLDTNLSLTGGGAPAELRAARRYARALAPGVDAGLITFNDGWQLILPPTASRARLSAALAAAPLAGYTSAGIRGALPGAVAALRRSGAAGGRVLVLSDAEVLTGSVTATVPTDVVTWYFESDDHPAVLRALAHASGGHIASPALAATLAAFTGPVASSTPAVQQAGSAPAVSAASGPRGLPGSLLIMGVLVFVALTGLGIMLLGSLHQRDKGRLLGAQIERYGPRRSPAPADGEGSVARTTVGGMTRLLRSSNVEPGLARRLDLAGITRSPAEWAVLGSCGAVVLMVMLMLLTGSLLLSVVLGAVITWLVMRLTLSMLIGRRRRAFANQLPDVLQLIAGSLQAGFSLPQALEAVVREDTQPIAGEFSRALAETRIGADLEDALNRVADRMESIDLRWTVMAIRIQREVGGNLAEVLRNTVATMRERSSLRRHVRALSAEGRLSAYVLVALPIVLAIWLFLTSRSYMKLLYTTLPGLLMLSAGVILVIVGALWMRKLIKVEL